MVRLSAAAVSLILLGAPDVALADVPGAAPAVAPDCPTGTRLEGPYRYWRCVPCRPDEACDPPVPAPSEPSPPPADEVTAPAPADEPAPAADPAEPAPRSAFGCSAARAASGHAWTLLGICALVLARRRRSSSSGAARLAPRAKGTRQ